jgi:uncharacterized protein (TIRG00374 family)
MKDRPTGEATVTPAGALSGPGRPVASNVDEHRGRDHHGIRIRRRPSAAPDQGSSVEDVMQLAASEAERSTVVAEVDPESSAPRRSRWRIALVVVGVAYAALTIVVLIINAAGLADAMSVVRKLQPWWVALALAAVVARHSFYSMQVGLLGQRAHGLDRRAAVAVELTVYGLGAITPAAPAEGLALASLELRRRGFSRREVLMTLGFSEWFTQQLFYEVAAVNVIVVVSVGHLSLAVGWPLVILAGLVIVVAAVFIVALARPAATTAIAMRVGRLPLLRGRMFKDERASALQEWCADTRPLVGTVRLRGGLVGLSALSVLSDGAVMWAATHAAGIHLPFDVILLATTAGVLAGLIPFLPGGIGVVDAAIPAVLHHYGVALDDAVAITIVYRALTLLLPMLAGVGSLLWLRRDDHRQLAR